MTLTIDMKASLPIYRKDQQLDPLRCWKSSGLGVIKKDSGKIAFSNTFGSCRDSFFRALPHEISILKGDTILVCLAVPKDSKIDYIKRMDNFIKHYSTIPYVSDIKYELNTEDIIGRGMIPVEDQKTYSGFSLKEEMQTLEINLLEMTIPIQLFANISTIWTLTYQLRKSLDLTYGDNTYVPFLKGHEAVLTTQYNDLVLTTKEKNIKDLYSKIGVFSNSIIYFNGPWGIFDWNKKIKIASYADRPNVAPLVEVYRLLHKYLDVDLLTESIRVEREREGL